MKKITKQQIKALHAALNRTKQMPMKKDIIYAWTDGRTTSSRELTFDEAKVLINKVNGNDPFDKIRKKVFALAYEAGIIYGNTPEDIKMNIAKLNMFLRVRGAVKQHLLTMDLKELKLVVNQFSAIVKANNNSKAKNAVNELLNECNINNIKQD